MRFTICGTLACVFLGLLPATAAGDSEPPASAITFHQYFEDVEFAPDGTYVGTEHREVRANNEAGVQGASRRTVSYDSLMSTVEVIEAHTLKADGRSIPVAPGAIFDRQFDDDGSVLSGRRQKVILFPQFEAGDTAVYTIKRSMREVYFPGQIEYGASYEPTAQIDELRETVKLPASLSVAVETHQMEMSKDTQGGFTTYSWRYKAHNPDPREVVPVSPLQRRPRYYISTFKDYNSLAAAYAGLAGPRIAVTPEIAKLANDITAGESGRRAQAEKLYEWVASHIRYVAVELGAGSMVPHDAQSILTNGYGDCKDHDALFQALLKAKGIKAESVLINLGNEYDLTDVPTTWTLNHAITYLPEFKLYADSTAEVAPFGVLPFAEYGKPVLHAGAHSYRSTTPTLQPGAVSTETITDEILEADGVLRGHTSWKATGPSSIGLRYQALAILRSRPAQYAADQLSRLGYDHGSGNFQMPPPKVPGPSYGFSGEFRTEGWSEKLQGKPFAIPRGLFVLGVPGDGPMGALLPGQLKDSEPTVCFSEQQSETITLHFPAKLQLADMPKDVDVETPNLHFTARWRSTPGQLRVERIFASHIDTPTCSGKVREQTVTALKTIREHYRTLISLKPVETTASASN